MIRHDCGAQGVKKPKAQVLPSIGCSQEKQRDRVHALKTKRGDHQFYLEIDDLEYTVPQQV